jgi:uncharacterized membrane protein YcaP (DUF421 family)
MDLWRIAVRAIVSYLFALLLVRISGKRTVGQASPFDFAIAVIVGDLFDDVVWAEVAASQFVAAMGAIFLAAAIVETASSRSTRVYFFVNGFPRILLRDGAEDLHALQRSQLSRADLEHLLRLDGIGQDEWNTVRLGIMEHDHHLSALLHSWAEPVQRKDAPAVARSVRS